MTMTAQQTQQAAQFLWDKWRAKLRCDGLPEPCRPQTRAEGYAIQAVVAELAGDQALGWKIAATSKAGQQHIGVDGPLGGLLLSKRVYADGASVPLAGNLMRVAEAEFAFRIGKDLPSRGREYTQSEVLDSVVSLHPGIEIPDSRYDNFTEVGAAQAIADQAFADYYVLGEPTRADWRAIDLAAHAVSALRNGTNSATGSGANVLGDPRIALTWLANELNRCGRHLRAGQVVTTGTCIVPVPVAPGDEFGADFGVLGTVRAKLIA